MKSLFEQNGGTYTKVGDYYIPNLTVPKCNPIGKCGMLCREYLKSYIYFKKNKTKETVILV